MWHRLTPPGANSAGAVRRAALRAVTKTHPLDPVRRNLAGHRLVPGRAHGGGPDPRRISRGQSEERRNFSWLLSRVDGAARTGARSHGGGPKAYYAADPDDDVMGDGGTPVGVARAAAAVSSSAAAFKMGRFSALPPEHPAYVTSTGVGSRQGDFDELLAAAVTTRLPPTGRPRARTADILAALRATSRHLLGRAFDPRDYGAVELLPLLRNCKYVTGHGGSWEYTRRYAAGSDADLAEPRFEQADDDGRGRVVGLVPYTHQEAPAADGVRTTPSRNAVLRWT